MNTEFLKSHFVRSLVFLALALLVVGSVELAPAQAVFAANNGQQLGISAPTGWFLSKVSVTGYNQRGVKATWGPVTCGTICIGSAITGGWWWIGSATVTFTLSNGINRTCSNSKAVDVPRNYNQDIYWVSVIC